jgi:two-component system KDP operon response regulator KdpE
MNPQQARLSTTGYPHLAFVVDDERPLRKLLRITMEAEGYEVIDCDARPQSLVQLPSIKPDVIVLDPGRVGEKSLASIETIRSRYGSPIVVLSPSALSYDKITALDAGADDYLTKPFNVPELMARLRALRRRKIAADNQSITTCELGDLHIDYLNKRVTRRGELLHFTRVEYGLLYTLASHLGNIVRSDQLLSETMGNNSRDNKHLLRVYIRQLREKLEDDPAHPRYLLTEIGSGYRLVRPAHDHSHALADG